MVMVESAEVVVIGLAPEVIDLDRPLAKPPTQDEIRRALRAVCVHRPQELPSGRYCVNCRALAECWLRCWGWRVLQVAGWPERAIPPWSPSSSGRAGRPGSGRSC
jgi:hypothetical protein